MKTPADGWSPEERDALADLERELEALQARHASDPRIDVLRAARAGVLPEPLQAQLTERLQRSRWDRTLVAGVDDVEPALDAEALARLFQRIEGVPQRSRWSIRPAASWRAGLAVAAVLLLAVAGWIWLDDAPGERDGEPRGGPALVDRRLPAPAFALALTAPEIKFSASALVFRGRGGAGLLNDSKTAFDAFRAGDYATARREFARLVPLYPSSVEVAFYDGVACLYLGDLESAEQRLAQAARMNDKAFAEDITWYRAVVDERAGRSDAARTRLSALCRGGGPRATQACAGREAVK